MLFAKECFVWDGNKRIPSTIYHKQKLMEILSPDARRLLEWLRKRNKQAVSIVEIVKTITPVSLRRAGKIRELMNELIKLGFAIKKKEIVVYCGRRRRECWQIIEMSK